MQAPEIDFRSTPNNGHSEAHQFVTRYTEGFSHFITSMAAPVAFGWSDGRVGLAPSGKAPPYHGPHPFRTFALPNDVEHWSLTTLREKLVKIGARVGALGSPCEG